MQPRKYSAGDNIIAFPTAWKFDAAVSQHFDEHINKSVPFYGTSQHLAASISDWFIEPNGLVVDFGCSTGTLIQHLSLRQSGKNVSFIGIDESPDMIEQAKAKTCYENVDFVCGDVLDFPTSRLSAGFCLYTLQFLTMAKRQQLVKQIYQALNPQGCLLVVEKIYSNNSTCYDIFNQLHFDYKSTMGFTESEIISKANSIRGVLRPLTKDENISLLESAGFSKVETFFQYGNFAGFLAIK